MKQKNKAYKIHHEHDSFFKRSFSNPQTMESLMHRVIDSSLLKAIEMQSLTLVNKGF